MDNNTYKVLECEGIGDVNVTREVVAEIAGIAALEVPGVDSLSNNIIRENVFKISGKGLSAGIRVNDTEGAIDISVSLIVKNGYSIPEVSKKVQENIKSAVGGMTGLNVGTVDIEIINIKVEK